MGINKEKIKALAERIVEVPEEFDISMWFQAPDTPFTVSKERGCQTAACYAGHQCLMDGLIPTNNSHVIREKDGGTIAASKHAAEVLGLNRLQEGRLFQFMGWPPQFRTAYHAAVRKGDWAGAACVAADRLKHFCQTDGEE